ncbi:MAG TPA: sigma 54-interacting transcriptional regulator [Silvibacterium sp.]|nr:sigma 54-interacting transcriptional regulator [Silvibacterium sp.]
MNQYRNIEDLLQALPSALHGLMSANTVTVVHVDGSDPVSSFAVNGNGLKSHVPPDLLQQTPSAYSWVYENQKPLVIPSVAEETKFRESMEWFRSNGDKSLCILPLGTALHPLGVLCVGRSSENAFSKEDVSLLVLAADYVALALDDRLNFAASEEVRLQLEDERTKLKLILDLNNSAASNQEPKELIQSISPGIRSVMQLDAVALMLPATDNGSLEIYALDSPSTEAIHSRAVDFPEEPAEQVFRTGKPWVGDTSGKMPQSPDRKKSSQERFQAICFLPLLRCNRALGVLSVARLRKESFTEQDVDFLLQIAGQIAIAIDNAVAYRKISELSDKLAQEKLYFEDEIRNELNFEEIVGNSAVLLRVLRQVQAVAPTDSTVLIYGETGSGKELIARAVHKLSRRNSHPFVKLNCAAIPTGLLESELFGHEKGAFTGAITQRIGRFELASEGTIFLDEVGEIPLELQPKLLRVLQEREFERLGNSRTLRSDARLIAATNRDLHAMVDSQKFRPDLFYRLNVFPVHVPPLRQRAEDIPFLVRHFAQHFARLMKRQIDTISTETMNALIRYPWPGNIRELQNVIERAVILSSGKELKVPISDLKPRLSENENGNGVMTLEEMERRHILYVLEQSNWIFSGPNGAAARLGMKRPTLQFRMQKLGISRPLRH